MFCLIFRFPNDERRVKWVEAVKGKGSDWVPSKSSRLCTLHFEAKHFWKNTPAKKPLLLPGAIPNPAPQLPPASTVSYRVISLMLVQNCELSMAIVRMFYCRSYQSIFRIQMFMFTVRRKVVLMYKALSLLTQIPLLSSIKATF